MRPPAAHLEILPLAAITPALWDELWRFTCRFYAADRAYVESRLKEHQELALFRSSADGSVVGMAAIHVEPMEFDGRKLLMIFTSHAILDESHRGQNLIQRAGLRTYLRSLWRHPLRRKYWVFDTFSYRSYLLLPRNLQEFWPRKEQPTPAWEAGLMDRYGRQRYGDAWEGGLVRRSPHKRLLPGTARLEPHMLGNPDLAFYAQANPGHAEGDMLLCLVPLTLSNWWGIVSKAVRRASRRRELEPRQA